MTVVAARPQVDDATTPQERSLPSWRLLATPLLAWLVSRAVVLSSVVVGNSLRDDGQTLSEGLRAWDSGWYLLAADGYELPDLAKADVGESEVAFFPLLPLLIRGTSRLTGLTSVDASLLVATVFGALAVVLVWLVAHQVSGRDVADRAAMLFAFFPGSVALSLVYSEGVMLTASAGCLLALLKGRWWLAGLLAALASAARPTGIAVGLACLVAAVLAIRRSRDWTALAAPALAPLGALLYLGWLWWATGAADTYFRVQREGWNERIDLGLATVQDVTDTYLRLPGELTFLDVPWVTHLRVLGLAFLIVALVLMVRWRPPAPLWAYTLAVVAPVVLSETLGARPRFLLTAFPLVLALAWAVRGVAFPAVLAGSACLLGLTALLHTTPGIVAP